MKENLGRTSQKSDLLAVILSFSAGIIQLLLFVTSTLAQVANFGNLFVYSSFVPFVILLSMIVALSLVGVISLMLFPGLIIC